MVTLNKQFRMHPTLGSFVSRSFYEPFGERIESPRPASDFAHNLPGYEGRVASWLDVPRSEGTEEKVGTSRCRNCEAAKVADEAKRLMEEAPGLTFGIITFYRAQAELILEYLHHLGVADRNPDTGTLDITSDYWRFTTDARGETVALVDTQMGLQQTQRCGAENAATGRGCRCTSSANAPTAMPASSVRR